MKKSTEQVILGAFALDDSIEQQVAKNAIAVLRAGGTGNAPADDRGVDLETAAPRFLYYVARRRNRLA